MKARVMAPETVCALRRKIAEIEGRPLTSIDLDPAAGDWGRGGPGDAAHIRPADAPPPQPARPPKSDARAPKPASRKERRSPRRGAPVLPFGVPEIDRAFRCGGLDCGALHEVHASESRAAGAATGFLAALLARLAARRDGFLLWAGDGVSPNEAAALHGPGLYRFGLDPGRILTASCRSARDVLWAMEEGLACPGLVAVVGEMRGDAKALDLTASRRLDLRARQGGVLTVLLRFSAREPAMTAATRWRVAPHPAGRDRTGESEANPGEGVAWRLDLERNRDGAEATWTVEWTHGECGFALLPTHPVDLAAASGDRPAREDAMGQVVALGRAS